MCVHLFNENGKFLRESKNLSSVLRNAKKRGVSSIKCELINSKFYDVKVTMIYKDGYRSLYNFASIEICNRFHSKRWNDVYSPVRKD